MSLKYCYILSIIELENVPGVYVMLLLDALHQMGAKVSGVHLRPQEGSVTLTLRRITLPILFKMLCVFSTVVPSYVNCHLASSCM